MARPPSPQTRFGVVLLSCVVLWNLLGCQPPPPPVVPEQANEPAPNAPATQGDTPGSSLAAPASAHVDNAENPGDGSWWSVPYPDRFDVAVLAHNPARVRVKGNRFVDDRGNTLVFHGVNISDPDKLARDKRWSKRHFEVVASWGADIVRIPVHPAAWRGRGRESYFTLLDDAVRWANELNLYLIIDWHSIGNLQSGMFQHPIHHTTVQETNEFWRAVSHRYAGVTTVAFYELFNEPTLYNGTLGSMSWSEWKRLVEEMVSIIAAHDPDVIPLVSGFDWAYDLRDAMKQPVNRKGIAYVSHPYPQKTTAPFEKNWDRDFGAITKRYPLFATEVGYMPSNAPGAHIPVKDDGGYGQRITDYLDKKGASWTAWCFEPDWPPQLIVDWDYTPTEAGGHFRAVMLEKAKLKALNQQLAAEAAAAKKAVLDTPKPEAPAPSAQQALETDTSQHPKSPRANPSPQGSSVVPAENAPPANAPPASRLDRGGAYQLEATPLSTPAENKPAKAAPFLHPRAAIRNPTTLTSLPPKKPHPKTKGPPRTCALESCPPRPTSLKAALKT